MAVYASFSSLLNWKQFVHSLGRRGWCEVELELEVVILGWGLDDISVVRLSSSSSGVEQLVDLHMPRQ